LPGPHPEAEAPAAAVPAAESPVPTAPAKPVARRGRRR
jgi:hypothetical protein